MKFTPWHIDKAEALINLWNQEWKEDFPMRKELFIQNSFKDSNVFYEGSRIALNDDNQVIGFIVTKKWQEQLDIEMPKETGWIQVLLVDKNYRNLGIAAALLTHAEKMLRESGIKQIALGKDPWHYFPGIPAENKKAISWFTNRGYRQDGTEHDLLCSYPGTDKIAVPSTETAEFSILRKEEQKGFLSFLRRCFPGRWEYEAIHYFAQGGTGREFVVLKRNDEILGFARMNDSSSPLIAQNVYWAPLLSEEMGGIGPLGIDPGERGKGYGLAIVEAAIALLRKRDIKNIVIDWTTLVTFYNKLGYEMWKSYDSYSKRI